MKDTDSLISLVRAWESHQAAPPDETPSDREARIKARDAAADAIRRNRERVFLADRYHRDEVLKVTSPENPSRLADAFEESSYLYYKQAEGRDRDTQAPTVAFVRSATDDLIAYALNSVPSCTITALPRQLDGPWTPDILAFYEKEAAETTKRITALVEGDLDRSQYNDLRSQIIKDAGIFGVGYYFFDDEEVLDEIDPDVARLLSDPVANARSKSRRRLLDVLKGRNRIKRIDPRHVYWQAGVASALSNNAGQMMNRVSVCQPKLTDELRAAYPEHGEIKPSTSHRRGSGRGTNSSDGLKYKPGGGQTTEVVTTWEVVIESKTVTAEVPVVNAMGMIEVHRTEYVERRRTMVKTVTAGGVLLHVWSWTEDEKTTLLPLVPCYLLENVNHPYGYSLPMKLKPAEDFINKVRLLIYEQAIRTFSNQAVAVLASRLGASDDPEQMEGKMREGGLVIIEGNEDEDGQGADADVRRIFMPLASMTAGVAPALIDLLRLEMENFKMSVSMIDQEAMARARTGFAKQQEQQAADRTKSIMLSNQSQAAEGLYERTASGWRRVTDMVAVPTKTGYVIINEPTTEKVRRFQNGQPVRFMQLVTPENPEGNVWDDVEGLVGDTRAVFSALSDARSWLPNDPAMRFEMLMALAQANEQGEALIVNKTLRDNVLPEQIREEDDRNREAIEKAQQATMAAQGAFAQPMGELRAGDEGWAAQAGNEMGAFMAAARPDIAALTGPEVEARLAALPLQLGGRHPDWAL